MKRYASWLLSAALLVVCGRSGAFITKLYSLQDVLNESSTVVVGRLEKVDAKARTAVATIDRTLKGKSEHPRILMNLGTAPAHHAEYLAERMVAGQAIIFYYRLAEGRVECVASTGDTWFQLFATDNPKAREKVWWTMSHLEIYLPRTFNGSTAELIKLTDDVIAKRVKPPAPDARIAPLDPKQPARAVVVDAPAGKTGGFFRQSQVKHSGGGEIRGVAFADVNGDERLDILCCRQNGNLLLINEPAGPRDGTAAAGLGAGSRSAGWADYDGDDHPDLLTNTFELFTNIGAKMRNDSRLVQVAGGRNPEGAGWIDHDNDGRPDAIIANGEYGIRLWANTGKGPDWFRDVSDSAGLGGKGLGVGNGDFLAVFDYDADGRADFFYNLGEGVLAHNDGGRFSVNTRSGIKLAGPNTKRGLAVGDFDNDGDLDLLIPGPGRVQLYRNNNDGTFTDVAADAGDLAKAVEPSFAAAWGDVNADGALDLVLCRPDGPTGLFLGDGRGKFTDAGKTLGVAEVKKACSAGLADLDGDGDLDLVLNLPDRVIVAANDIPRRRGWTDLCVRLGARRGTVGAVVRLLDDRARPIAMRELGHPDGAGGQSGPAAHFGVRDGAYRVSAVLSDGRVAARDVTIAGKSQTITLAEDEFK